MQPVRYGYSASISLHRSQARASARRGHLLGRQPQWCMYRSNSKAPWRYAPRYACWEQGCHSPIPKSCPQCASHCSPYGSWAGKASAVGSGNLFFDAANRAASRIKDSQAMPPGKLTLDHKQGIPIFIVNIIAVEPGEHPLLEKHLHCVTSLHLPAQYLLPASHLLALCLL